MPQLGQGLGHFDPEPVEQEILLVLVVVEQSGRRLADRGPHRDDVEGGVVDLAGLDRPEEVGDAQEGLDLLAGVVEPGCLRGPGLVGPDDEIVPVTVGREVPVDHLGNQHPRRLGGGELLAERGPDAGLELVVGLRATLGVGSGRNCHWLRYSAVSLTYSAISSSPMPLTTREPMNGGVNTGLSVTDLG